MSNTLKHNAHIQYQETGDAVTLVVRGKLLSITKDHDAWDAFVEAWNSGNEDAIYQVLQPRQAITEFSHGKFIAKNGKIYYDGAQVHHTLCQRILNAMRRGETESMFLPVIKFLVESLQNPSPASREEGFDFLKHLGLKLCEDGHFIAFKGVRPDYYSWHGNTETRVLKGKVNKSGQIYNAVGEEILVMREDVDDDRRWECSNGIHVGTLDFAQGWANGGHMMVVKVNPRNIVSVPTQEDCQKCRVTGYVVVDEYTPETAWKYEKDIVTLADIATQPQAPQLAKSKPRDKTTPDHNWLRARTISYLDNCGGSATLRELANSLSPQYVPLKQFKAWLCNQGEFEVDGSADSLGGATVALLV